MTIVLLTLGIVGLSMGMLGIGVLLNSRQPLKGSCRSVGNGAGCDTCQCSPPPE